MSERGQAHAKKEDMLLYKTVVIWFSRGSFAEETKKNYLRYLRVFMAWIHENGKKFADMTPDDLIDHQKKARRSFDDEAEFEIIDELIQPWIKSIEKKHRDSTLTQKISVIYSFFKWNRATLPEWTIGKKAGVPKVMGDLSSIDIRKICSNSSTVYNAIFLCMYMGAMDQKFFTHWNTVSGYKSIEDDIEKGSDIIIIWSPGRKKELNIMPFYTMIGGNAVEALRKYVKGERKRTIDRYFGGDPEKATAIFYNRCGNAIKRTTLAIYWHRKLSQLGLIVQKNNGYSGNRYGKNLHEIRDTWRTKATSFYMDEKIPIEIFEFMMGHVSRLDPNEYDKYCKNQIAMKMQYRKAIPYFNIMTSNKAIGLYDEEEVEKERDIERKKAEARSKVIKDSPLLSALQDQLNDLANTYEQIEPVN